MRNRTTLATAALSLAASLPSPAGASSQGTLAATSTGSVTIVASVSPRAQVAGLSDIAFADSGAAASRRAHNLCVWGNANTQPYALLATGSGPAGSFELSNGTASMGYTVEWLQTQPSEREPVGPTGASVQAAASKSECETGRGSIGLVIALEGSRASASDSPTPYAGVLRLTVSPQ